MITKDVKTFSWKITKNYTLKIHNTMILVAIIISYISLPCSKKYY